MSKKYIEITRIDPKRWALLHLPFGFGLSIWVMIIAYQHHSELDLEFLFFAIFIPTIFIFITMLVAWAHAQFINVVIYIAGKGLVLETRPIIKTGSGGWAKPIVLKKSFQKKSVPKERM